MATFLGVNFSKKNVSVPAEKIAGKDHSGKIRVSYDSYVFVTNVVTGANVIKLMKIPKGARVVDVKVKCPSLGTTGTFTLGYEANGVDVADADGFLVAASINAGGQAVLGVPTFASAAILKEFTAETQVTLNQTIDTTAALGLAIEVAIFYTLE